MIRDIKIAIIGGDKRQSVCAKQLSCRGFSVSLFGLCEGEDQASLEECLKGAEVVLLPLPYGDIRRINTRGDISISAEEIFSRLTPPQLVLGAKIDKELYGIAEKYGIKLIDYLEREELNILNAVPTAEGALELAMNQTDITIHGSNSVVLGFGRIGKVLAGYLQALGAKVSVGARKESSRAWVTAMGYRAFDINEPEGAISKADIVFNTIPKTVFTKELLEILPDTALIIDLASKPGGVDMTAAKALGKRVIWALSLPGKVAPVTAGKIIESTVESILKEEGII